MELASLATTACRSDSARGIALSRWISNVVILAAVASCAGCDDGKPGLVPVSGQVLIDGKPLDFGFVRFAAPNARPAMGRLDADGRFTLTCYTEGDGAVVGTHRVAVMAHEPTSGEQIKWHAPKKYANYATSGLTQEITKPTDSLVIELSWGDERPPK